MNRILSIVLIGLYALTLTQAYMPHVNYWMNRDYISSELCENKDRPELECNGKCHLKKQIKENSEDQNDGQEVTARMMVEFFQVSESFKLKPLKEAEAGQFFDYTDPIEIGFRSNIFHPPRV